MVRAGILSSGGGTHGLLLIVEDVLRPSFERFKRYTDMNTSGIGYCFLQMTLTFSMVTGAWIFFRMHNISDALKFIYKIFADWNPWVLFDDSLYRVALSRMEWGILLVALGLLFLGDLVRYAKEMTIARFLHEECLLFRWIVLWLLFFSVAVFGIYGPDFDPKQFIYFQF